MLRRLLAWLPGAADERGDGPDPQARADRIREIGRDPLQHGQAGTDEVLDALEDRSPLVRATAAEILGSVEVYHELVPADPLIGRLDDPDREVRLAAARALTITTDATAVDDVLPYALDDDPGVRAAGAVGLYHALTRVTYEFTPAQVEALLDSVAAAGESRGSNPEDADLGREYLLATLDRGAAPQDLTDLDAERTATLVAALDDESAAVRAQAATLLGLVENDAARQALRDARENDPDERVRDAAADGLRNDTG
ncbi:HEAT repeat domain-containing protein [Halorientalis halophila]|uniref:HEAT repeat domain-containing protein n=1 Tax=Halorientalis halophila TaxID=3108499 RepID=UPI00300ABDCB